jgi:hypothetical protein
MLVASYLLVDVLVARLMQHLTRLYPEEDSQSSGGRCVG